MEEGEGGISVTFKLLHLHIIWSSKASRYNGPDVTERSSLLKSSQLCFMCSLKCELNETSSALHTELPPVKYPNDEVMGNYKHSIKQEQE